MQDYNGKVFVKRLKQVSGEEKGYRLAKKIGVSESTLSKWNTEKNIPQLKDLYSIYNQYHCSIDDLLGLDGKFDITPANICRTIVDLDIHCVNAMTITANPSEVTINLKLPNSGSESFAIWYKNHFGDSAEIEHAREDGKQFANITAIIEFLQNYAKLRTMELDDMAETVVDSLLSKVNDRASQIMNDLHLDDSQSNSVDGKRKED